MAKNIRARLPVATPEAIRALEAFAESPEPIEPATLLANLRLMAGVLAGLAVSVDGLIHLVAQTSAEPLKVSEIRPTGSPWSDGSGDLADA